MSSIKKRTLYLFYAAIAINLALALLPTYDAFNVRCWISLGSTITSSAPPMINNAWPGGFFSFMFLTPLYLTYLSSGFNIYASVVALKLVLFVFTVLTAFLLYRITQKVKPRYADAVLLFSLLNPAILYINYFWTQVDILPIFFFTLGYALLRYVNFNGSNLKRYLIGFLPILVSAFIYRYSLVLIPALILYDSAGFKQKASALAIAVMEAGALFAIEFAFFRGGLYNYVGALSGSVINMSGVEGLQYWIGLPQVPYLIFLGVLGLAVPFLLKTLKYRESATLFFVLLIFIYSSAVPLADYFIWLYPIGIFLALSSGFRASFNKKLLLTSLPIFVGLFFISFIVGNGVQTGPFYFAYPLLHLDVPLMVSSPQTYTSWVYVFNLFLLGSVLLTSWFCLAPFNREQNTDAPAVWIGRWKTTFTSRWKALSLSAVVLLVLLGFGFNGILSQPVIASSNQVFPLYLFPAVNSYDSSPTFGTYYLSWAGLVVYNNWSQPISFNHPLNLQNSDLNLSFSLQTNSYGRFELLKTDNYTVGIAAQPNFTSSDLSTITPSWQSGQAPQKIQVPFFNVDSNAYTLGPSSFLYYSLNDSSVGSYYVTAFKFLDTNTSQNLFFHFGTGSNRIEYTISSTAASVFYNNLITHNTSFAAVNYNNFSSSGWNLLVFKLTDNAFYSWINNKALNADNCSLGTDANLMVESNFYDSNSSSNAVVTQLYSTSTWSPLSSIERSLFVHNSLSDGVHVPFNETEVNLYFEATPTYSKATVSNYSFMLQPVSTVGFGKLSGGDYGLSVQLNYLQLSQKADGYYFLPVYFAVVLPFVVALLSLPLIMRRRETAASDSP